MCIHIYIYAIYYEHLESQRHKSSLYNDETIVTYSPVIQRLLYFTSYLIKINECIYIYT